MAIENFQEVQTYLESQKENAEVKTYLDTFKVQPSLEVFKSLASTDVNYKSFMDSEKDNHYKKAHATWETNNLEALVSAKVKELYPTADPKDIELNKMKAMIEQMQNDGTKKDLTNKALKIAEQKKLPSSIIDFFVGSDEATTTKNLEALESVFSAQVEALVLERLKGTTPKIGGGATTTISKEDISKMTTEEINANWSEISKIMK